MTQSKQQPPVDDRSITEPPKDEIKEWANFVWYQLRLVDGFWGKIKALYTVAKTLANRQ